MNIVPASASTLGTNPEASALPLAVVLNPRSGREPLAQRLSVLRRLFAEAGRQHAFFMAERGADLPSQAALALGWAKARQGAVIAAGGDGTINSVVQTVLPSGLPFGVLPQGTFNYFGRAHGIPANTEQAARRLLQSQPRPIQVGLLNDRAFLVNASLGLYPRLLEDREAYKRHYGRNRIVALFAALATVLSRRGQWLIEIEQGGQRRSARTSTLFVGNNRLQLDQVGIEEGALLDQDRLAAVMVDPVGPLALLGLGLRGALGRLGGSEHVTSFGFRQLTVRPARGSGKARLKVAIDGEVMHMQTPLVFRVSPQPLQLLWDGQGPAS
ncbi:MAG TPA: diacylglycerol kinase family protein [Ideonella sp.]|uniref:diacylglycerol/lipid kinase family protein n=1 Tax=Ideonella sp. TaxID=1929293 RepID=UPI002BE19F12|nr:diacylglycerol kinase family protein [Ideonella sp.]HSI49863.1 diacylglycerol kinase family protein [Ideonella sp.]